MIRQDRGTGTSEATEEFLIIYEVRWRLADAKRVTIFVYEIQKICCNKLTVLSGFTDRAQVQIYKWPRLILPLRAAATRSSVCRLGHDEPRGRVG